MRAFRGVGRPAAFFFGVLAAAPAWGFQSMTVSTQALAASLTAQGTVTMTITMKNIADNQTTNQIYWSGVTLPVSFVRAAVYVQLDSTITATGGGIQIYTDNTAVDADPRFTYVSSTNTVNPAGLVDATTTTLALPMMWSVKDTTASVPTAADPNNTGDANSFQWLYAKDKQTPDIPSANTTAFSNGEAYITLKRIVDIASSGIHFGQSPTEFGSAGSPDFVYFEADFRNAQPRSYRTNALRFEAYTQ